MMDNTKQLSRETLLAILDNLPTSIFVKDENLRFVFCNKQNQRYIGKDLDQLLGNSDVDFYVGDQLAGFISADSEVITTGHELIVEELASPMLGGSIPVLTRKARLKTSDGKTYLIGTNSDLTEIKKREEQYRALAETVPVGVVQLEEDGRVSFSNPLFLASFGFDSGSFSVADVASMLGKPVGFPGQTSRFECQIINSTGQSRHVLVISSGWLVLSKDGGRSAIVSVVDVSENIELRRINDEVSRLNMELAASMKQLTQAQEALIKKGKLEQMGQLTATIAHELRNPLGSIRTSIFLVERKIKDKGLGVEMQLQRVNNGIGRCDSIITQLLDFSRTKRVIAQPDDLDQWLARIVEEEVKRLSQCITVSCYLELDGAKIPFDGGRLQRAIVNLLSNAAEAMVGNTDAPLAGMSQSPRIDVRTRFNGGYVEIEISDNGPGLSPEMIDKIREPLFTTKSFGTGLGVPAVEQIAAQHGGSLEITSNPGAGARFVVKLPTTVSSVTGEAA